SAEFRRRECGVPVCIEVECDRAAPDREIGSGGLGPDGARLAAALDDLQEAGAAAGAPAASAAEAELRAAEIAPTDVDADGVGGNGGVVDLGKSARAGVIESGGPRVARAG